MTDSWMPSIRQPVGSTLECCLHLWRIQSHVYEIKYQTALPAQRTTPTSHLDIFHEEPDAISVCVCMNTDIQVCMFICVYLHEDAQLEAAAGAPCSRPTALAPNHPPESTETWYIRGCWLIQTSSHGTHSTGLSSYMSELAVVELLWPKLNQKVLSKIYTDNII